MIRPHVHIHVPDQNALDRAIALHSVFLGEPIKQRPGYVKWEPQSMNICFVISIGDPGLSHIGYKGEDASEVLLKVGRLRALKFDVKEQRNARCCHAETPYKGWIHDCASPVEIYYGGVDITEFGGDHMPNLEQMAAACCAPGSPEDCCP